MKRMNENIRNLLYLVGFFIVLAGPASAACTNPAGNERDIIYNQDYQLWQFCDGTDWWAMKSGGANTGGSAATAAGNEGEVQFNNSGSFGASPNLYWDDINSRFGIGVSPGVHPLELGGEVKIGNTGASCMSANEGMMRYNAQLKMLQYCNGAYWTSNFGGSSSLRSVQIFDTAGNYTWTKPAGITAVEVVVVGAGGGGCTRIGNNGIGGGGGGTCIKRLDVSAISSESVTVGAGGTGVGADAIGGAGGNSSFGSYSAGGGGGGNCSSNFVASGGSVSGCDVNINGNDAYRSGGSSSLGGGGYCRAQDPGGPGTHGGGGGGVCITDTAGTGGNGGDGVVIVWEYGP